MIFSSSICAILFIGIALVYGLEHKEAEKPLVDYLTTEYLSTEQDLWSKIKNYNDRSSLYDVIRNSHHRFIAADYGAVASKQNPSTTIHLVNSLFYNATVLLNSNNLALEDIVYLFRDKILTKAIRYSNDVFNDASRADFWAKGRDSLEQCRQTELPLTTIESEFHLIYNYYKDVRVALLKTYILTQLSHMLLHINNNNNEGHQASLPYTYAKESHNAHIAVIKRNVKNLLKIAKRDAWLCDKNPTANGENAYEQITKFLQGYVDHELNFNNEDTCQPSCSDYKQTKHLRCADKTMCANEQNEEIEKLSICNGQIHDCVDINNDNVEICLAESRSRRYHYLKYNNGQMRGIEPAETCAAVRHSTSWRRWFLKCNSCYCLCDDPFKSERHFSLHEVVSDIEQNKVVTGIRIVKRNGVIQLSISQRALLPYGQTDVSESDTWKEATNQFAVTDRNAINGIDYFTLTYENRSINLDDLMLPEGKLVTGVRFNVLNGHIILQIRATDFNYYSGHLENITYNPWAMNEKGGQFEIEIPKKFNPLTTMMNDIFIPNHLPHTYVQFSPTDFESDAGQLTIPFIETIPLESKNPMILSGIGLTYKSNDASAGFIGVKLISYDFAIADPEPDEEYDYID